MGQQQLLLVVLAVAVTGILFVVGIKAFGQNALQANTNAVLQDLTTVASQAQAWFRKPSMLGGGGRSFMGITMGRISAVKVNENGTCQITGVKANRITLIGTGSENVRIWMQI